MSRFKKTFGLDRGQLIGVFGAPKTGKSWFLGSVAEIVPAERIALLCPKPREANSHLYLKHGVQAEIFHDPEFDPEVGSLKATAFNDLTKRINALYADDTIDVVIVDPITDAMTLLENALLAQRKAGSTADLAQDRFAYYGDLKKRAERFIGRLGSLTVAPSPKMVLASWHVMPAKENDDDAGVTYEGKVLPMMSGTYKDKAAADFDAVVYSKIKMMKGADGKFGPQHVIVVKPIGDLHAGVASISDPAETFMPNNFKALLEVIQSDIA